MCDGERFWVYILENPAGRFYIGQTDDLPERMGQHNDPHADGRKFAPKNGSWRLVWSEPHPDRASAIRRERQIKSMKSARWIRDELLNR